MDEEKKMTTEKTKAALDDFEYFATQCRPFTKFEEERYERIKSSLTAQAEAQPADAQRQEEKTCTCGAAGSGEGHTDWCDWLDVECPAVPQHVIEHGDSLDEFKSSVGIAVEACEKLAAIRDCDEPHQGNGQLKASALRQAASSLRYFANTVSSPNRNDLPCETCKGNADSCADVPSLRHCEAENRESPQAEAQPAEDDVREALDKLKDECDDIISRAKHQIKHCHLDGHTSEEHHQEGRIQAAIDIRKAIDQALIRAALRAPAAVPQEVVKRAVEEAISEATTCWNPRPSGVFQYERAIGIANRLIALLGGKEG